MGYVAAGDTSIFVARCQSECAPGDITDMTGIDSGTNLTVGVARLNPIMVTWWYLDVHPAQVSVIHHGERGASPPALVRGCGELSQLSQRS